MAPRSYPRVYIKNSLDIFCQIIRNENEMARFNKLPQFRRCLIDDFTNFQYWKKGEAPYNDENMTFGITKKLYEIFSGEV